MAVTKTKTKNIFGRMPAILPIAFVDSGCLGRLAKLLKHLPGAKLRKVRKVRCRIEGNMVFDWVSPKSVRSNISGSTPVLLRELTERSRAVYSPSRPPTLCRTQQQGDRAIALRAKEVPRMTVLMSLLAERQSKRYYTFAVGAYYRLRSFPGNTFTTAVVRRKLGQVLGSGTRTELYKDIREENI